jgi:hypothetical protein
LWGLNNSDLAMLRSGRRIGSSRNRIAGVGSRKRFHLLLCATSFSSLSISGTTLPRDSARCHHAHIYPVLDSLTPFKVHVGSAAFHHLKYFGVVSEIQLLRKQRFSGRIRETDNTGPHDACRTYRHDGRARSAVNARKAARPARGEP